MTNQAFGIAFSVNSVADFSRHELAEEVVGFLLRQEPAFVPTRYAQYPPAKTMILGHFSDVVDTWTSKTTRSTSDPESASGGVALESATGVRYLVSWEGRRDAPPPSVAGVVPDSIWSAHDALLHLQRIVEQMCVLTGAFYGEARTMLPGWEKPYDFRLRLPDVPWLFVLGPPLVDHFGKARLLSSPVFRVAEYSPGFVSLLVTHSPEEGLSENVKARVREHLGDENFMSGGRWRYKNGGLPPLTV